MQSQSKFSLGTISQLTAIILVLGLLPALGQSSKPASRQVPATARQAASMPEFASRLAKACRQGSARPVSASRQSRPSLNCLMTRSISPFDASDIYDNGPVNGQVDAWTVNFGYSVTDSLQASATDQGLQFWVWLIPGDTISNIEISFGSAAYGTELFDGFVNVTASNCFGNSFGYNVCMETASITNGPSLNGNAWVTLQNANVPSGDPVYWDENSGIGCTSQGCPSQAQENSIGTIPSEAFTVTGATSTTTQPPPPPPCFGNNDVPIIHSFTASEGLPNGVTNDQSGNIYGTTSGGDYGAGMIYRLVNEGGTWLMTYLYSFLGDATGSSPSPLITGRDNALYGTAVGGIRNCGQDGSSYCGLIFRLRPRPIACTTAMCGWQEDILYRFHGTSDGSNPQYLSFDSAGNLYGIAAGGIVFKLSPAVGGWTEQVLYTFYLGQYGGLSGLVAAPDGTLYGLSSGTSDGYYGAIFQLAQTGGVWTKSILYVFQDGEYDGAGPANLFRDDSGNLYGTSVYRIDCGDWNPVIFELSPSGQGWIYQGSYLQDRPNFYDIDNYMVDPQGDQYYSATHYHLVIYWGEIYDWTEISGSLGRYRWVTNYFVPGGPLAEDSTYLYGTTASCGQYGSGTVWQVSR